MGREDEIVLEVEITPFFEVKYMEDKAWGAYACESDHDPQELKRNHRNEVSISGIMQRLNLDAKYKAKVVEKYSDKWGYQYNIKSIWQDVPKGVEGQKEYFSTLLTELQLQAVYAAYPEPETDIIQLFKDDTFDYEKVYGFGAIVYEKVKKRVLDNLEFQEALFRLEQYGIKYNMVVKLVKHFGSTGVMMQRMENNPYCLTEVNGVGFLKADAIAKEMGYDLTSPKRIHAAIFHIIEQTENDGDTYVTQKNLVVGSAELLKIKKDLIRAEFENLEEVVKIDDRFALKKTFIAEKGISNRLQSILKRSNEHELNFDVEDFIKRMEIKYKHIITKGLSEQQKQFFHNIKKYGVNFLVGYAGCGKSMLQMLLIDLLEELHLTYILMAPTGKAAKVLSKYTGKKAWTIHKATGIGRDADSFSKVNIYQDFIIIDESSMCGVTLVWLMLQKLKNPAVRILFIGDSFQLPSVDKGNFLYDCQESGVFPVTLLDVVFRQSEGGILDVVTKMRKGEKFIDDNFVGVKKFGNNCVLVSCEQAKMEAGYKYYYNYLMKNYGIDGTLILSPTKKGKLGTYQINNNVQELINPSKQGTEEIAITKDGNDIVFRVGDNVINVVNTYDIKALGDVNPDHIKEEEKSESDNDKYDSNDSNDSNDNDKPKDTHKLVDVMNGETGKIIYINAKERLMHVQYDFATVITPASAIDNLLLSACITMHKSQGSSSDAILSITDKSNKFTTTANLVYTAWTRTREFLIILCQADVINSAMKKIANLRRKTFLCDILKGIVTYEVNEKPSKQEESTNTSPSNNGRIVVDMEDGVQMILESEDLPF